jgi:hypothetical protein
MGEKLCNNNEERLFHELLQYGYYILVQQATVFEGKKTKSSLKIVSNCLSEAINDKEF